MFYKFEIFKPFRISRAFTSLWTGQFLSGLGDQVFNVILPIVVYSVTPSATVMSVLMALRVIPQVLFQPFTGVLVDRFPRASMMLASDSMRFGLLLMLAFVGMSHHLTISVLDVSVLLFGAMSCFFRPAYMALRRQIFTSEIRTAAISLTQIGSQVASLIGPSLGGLIMTFASSTVGFVFDAMTFLVSIVSLLFIRGTNLDLKSKPSGVREQSFMKDLIAGYQETMRHPWIWVGILVWTFIIISYSGIIPILLPWLIKVHYKYPNYAYGLVVSMSGIGAILAGFIVGSARRLRFRGIISYSAVAIQGVALFFMAFSHSLPVLMLMMAVSAAGSMAFGIIHEGILQELVPQEMFGRVISLEVFSACIAQPIGYFVTGVLFHRVGGVHAMMFQAALLVVVVVATLFIPAIRKFQ